MELDRYDRAIVRLLQQDARITNTLLAEKVSLSESACLRRVRALEESGLVQGYTALIDQQKAGYPVTVEPATGTRSIVVPAIEKGQIDLEADYAGSLLNFLHGNGASLPAANSLTTAVPALKAALKNVPGAQVLTCDSKGDPNAGRAWRSTPQMHVQGNCHRPRTSPEISNPCNSLSRRE